MSRPRDDPDASAWVPVARRDEMPDGSGAAVTVGGRPVAVFRAGDRAFALDGRCPHQGANLAGGAVGAGPEGPTVTCPRRGCLRWRFDLATGASADGLAVACATHPARIEAGTVLVARRGEA